MTRTDPSRAPSGATPPTARAGSVGTTCHRSPRCSAAFQRAALAHGALFVDLATHLAEAHGAPALLDLMREAIALHDAKAQRDDDAGIMAAIRKNPKLRAQFARLVKKR